MFFVFLTFLLTTTLCEGLLWLACRRWWRGSMA